MGYEMLCYMTRSRTQSASAPIQLATGCNGLHTVSTGGSRLRSMGFMMMKTCWFLWTRPVGSFMSALQKYCTQPCLPRKVEGRPSGSPSLNGKVCTPGWRMRTRPPPPAVLPFIVLPTSLGETSALKIQDVNRVGEKVDAVGVASLLSTPLRLIKAVRGLKACGPDGRRRYAIALTPLQVFRAKLSEREIYPNLANLSCIGRTYHCAWRDHRPVIAFESRCSSRDRYVRRVLSRKVEQRLRRQCESTGLQKTLRIRTPFS